MCEITSGHNHIRIQKQILLRNTVLPASIMLMEIVVNLLNDLDKLPKHTITMKADGHRGDTRSISIPVIQVSKMQINLYS